ncbi:hypothetical protein GCM10010921_29650 [Microbacterium album]|uniref:Uncharacterized protein n=1 Tax=Microbacterium album TaxID=2053191 RepID=A0A917IIJ6_9MICO|nr:hypothetical protein GCM10010921_29650 [Microbacterium album]
MVSHTSAFSLPAHPSGFQGVDTPNGPGYPACARSDRLRRALAVADAGASESASRAAS